jgi:predicted nucleic acid-binding protein
VTRYLIDSSVYIRAFREAAFGAGLQEFHRQHLSHLLLSAVVAAEILVGAKSAEYERRARRGLIEPFRDRRRLITPSWAAWDRAAQIDRRLRTRAAHRNKLDQRSFFQDILIAASAREFGAAIITENRADFALIARYVDVEFVTPWPTADAGST